MSKTDPNHYKDLDPEPIDLMRLWFTREEYQGYLKGSVIKYLSRAGRKPGEKSFEDIDKARWFLEKLSESMFLEWHSEFSEPIGEVTDEEPKPRRIVPRYPAVTEDSTENRTGVFEPGTWCPCDSQVSAL